MKEVNGLKTSMNNIVKSFESLKIVCIVTVVCGFAACGCIAYFSMQKSDEARHRIYVLDNGQSFSATWSDESLRREDEARYFMTNCLETLFNLAPDMSVIKESTDRVIALSDKSVFQYRQKTIEDGYYKRLVSNDCTTRIHVDELKVDMSRYPYTASAVCSRLEIRPSAMSKFRFSIECTLQNVPRSSVNPNGFMLCNFNVKEDVLLDTRKR